MMWTLVLSSGAVFLGVFALEMSVLPAQREGHAWADPAAALVSVIGWRWGALAGFGSGMLIGLFEDCLVSRFIGNRAIGLAMVGAVAGGLRRVIERDAFFSLSVVGAVACVAGDLASYASLWILNLRLSTEFLVTRILPYQAVSGAVLVLPADAVVNLLMKQHAWAARRRPGAKMGTRG